MSSVPARRAQPCRLVVLSVPLEPSHGRGEACGAGDLRDLRDSAAVGKKFGKTFAEQIRRRAPARGDKWHMDEVRRVDRRRTTLALARRRSEWFRARRSGSTSKRQPCSAAVHEQAPEIRRDAAARHDHGQTPFIRCSAGEDWPSPRTSPAQGPEQSGRELSSADQTARTDHEAIQISPAGTTILVGSRSSREPLPHPSPRLRHSRFPPRLARASLCGLARDFQDRRRRLTPALGK